MSDDDRHDTEPEHPDPDLDPDLDPEQGADPDLDPEQEARLRALLADLGSDPAAAQMPPEVTARLEDTLAELTSLRAAQGPAPTPAQTSAQSSADGPTRSPGEGSRSTADPDSATVVPLSGRRRRSSRWAAAAAAVIVLGAGGVAVAGLDLLGTGTPTADDASAGGQSKAESLDDSGASAPQTAPSTPGGAGADQRSLVGAELPELRSSAFADDAAALLAATSAPRESKGTAGGQAQDGGGDDGATEGAEPSNPACPGPTGRRAADEVRRLTVTYDGRLAILLVRAPSSGTQVLEAWTCAGDRLLDRARIPAP